MYNTWRGWDTCYLIFLNSLFQFIEERLRCLNSGVPKNDEFEKEITNIERNRPQVGISSLLQDLLPGML